MHAKSTTHALPVNLRSLYFVYCKFSEKIPRIGVFPWQLQVVNLSPSVGVFVQLANCTNLNKIFDEFLHLSICWRR